VLGRSLILKTYQQAKCQIFQSLQVENELLQNIKSQI